MLLSKLTELISRQFAQIIKFFSLIKSVFVSNFTRAVVESFSRNFREIAHGRAAGTPFLITFLWW
jgi:hypothetical protein